MTVRMGDGYGCMPAKVEYNRKNGLSCGKLENGKEFDKSQFGEKNNKMNFEKLVVISPFFSII